MEKTIPTAEELFYSKFKKEGGLISNEDLIEYAIDFAKLHVQACKEEISDDYLYYLDGDEGSERLDTKKFFKESYPIKNIK